MIMMRLSEEGIGKSILAMILSRANTVYTLVADDIVEAVSTLVGDDIVDGFQTSQVQHPYVFFLFLRLSLDGVDFPGLGFARAS